jgi:hypothetical protein
LAATSDAPLRSTGVRAFDDLVRHRIVLHELAITRAILCAAREFRRRSAHFRLLLVDDGRLQRILRLQLDHRRTRARQFGVGLREACVVVARIEADQHLSGLHALVVLHEHIGDEAVDLRREHRDIAAHVGIVGRLNEAQHERPPGRRGDQREPDQPEREQHPGNLARRPREGRRRDRWNIRRRCRHLWL